ncbi:MAG: phosphatase PAP2 family protein, partial [Thermoanaerobaculaceae bacterium]
AWAGVLYGSWPSFPRRWVLPVVASGVALARVREGHHFLGDVAFGAALGWWIGFRLASAHGGESPSGAAIVAIPGGLAYRLTLP